MAVMHTIFPAKAAQNSRLDKHATNESKATQDEQEAQNTDGELIVVVGILEIRHGTVWRHQSRSLEDLILLLLGHIRELS